MRANRMYYAFQLGTVLVGAAMLLPIDALAALDVREAAAGMAGARPTAAVTPQAERMDSPAAVALAGPSDSPDPGLLDLVADGDVAAEQRFIDAVHAAARDAPPAPPSRWHDTSGERDGSELARRLQTLGVYSPPRSMQAVCLYLRSPLKKYVPNNYERSVRFFAYEILLNAYPLEGLAPSPRSQADWVALEHFCSKRLGVAFDGPTPVFKQDRAYPRFRGSTRKSLMEGL